MSEADTKPNTVVAEKLTDFLSRLPASLAVRLSAALEQERVHGGTNLPYDLLLGALASKNRRQAVFDPLRQFCLPFEDLLVNKADGHSLTPEIERSAIMPVWSWLETELLPDTLPDINRRLIDYAQKNDDVARDGLITVQHATCSSAILSALKASRGDAKIRAALEKKLGGESVIENARKMAEALSIALGLKLLQRELPKRIEDFDTRMVVAAEQAYKAAAESSPAHAIYIAWIVMRRLAYPWQILRLAKKLAGVGNDGKLNRTTLYEVGEAFINEMDNIAESFAGKRKVVGDSDEMLARVSYFVDMSKGFIGEIDIRRCSEWGQRILAARAKLSSALSEEMSRFEHEVARALPFTQIGSYGKAGPKKPDLAKAPKPDLAEQVNASLRFLKGACAAAESIGLQAHCKTVTQQIHTYLATYEDRLLEDIRNGKPNERENAEAYLDIVIGFHEAMGSAIMADTLRRRGVVAISASA